MNKLVHIILVYVLTLDVGLRISITDVLVCDQRIVDFVLLSFVLSWRYWKLFVRSDLSLLVEDCSYCLYKALRSSLKALYAFYKLVHIFLLACSRDVLSDTGER